VEVSLDSSSQGQGSLIGNTTVTFVNGTAAFTDLGVERAGTYVLHFNITYPLAAAGYNLQSMPLVVSALLRWQD
jgi:hypothetical protein